MIRRFFALAILLSLLVIGIFAAPAFTTEAQSSGWDAITVSPQSGNWNYPGYFVLTAQRAVTVSWSIHCTDYNCGRPDEPTTTHTFAAGESVTVGWGHQCYRWQLDTIGGEGFVANAEQNLCTAATSVPAATAAAPTATHVSPTNTSQPVIIVPTATRPPATAIPPTATRPPATLVPATQLPAATAHPAVTSAPVQQAAPTATSIPPVPLIPSTGGCAQAAAPTATPTPTAVPQTACINATPTAQATAVSLPNTGNGPTGSLFDEFLHVLFQTQSNPPASAEGHSVQIQPLISPVTRLVIPALNLDANVQYVPLQNGTWDLESITNNIAWLGNTSRPDIGGNTVLAGHITYAPYTNGPFLYLSRLKPGDVIYVYTTMNVFTYKVKEQKVIQPDDLSVTNPTDNPQITLLTCTNWDPAAQHYDLRRAVIADLVSVSP